MTCEFEATACRRCLSCIIAEFQHMVKPQPCIVFLGYCLRPEKSPGRLFITSKIAEPAIVMYALVNSWSEALLAGTQLGKKVRSCADIAVISPRRLASLRGSRRGELPLQAKMDMFAVTPFCMIKYLVDCTSIYLDLVLLACYQCNIAGWLMQAG